MGNITNCEQDACDYFVVEVKEESRPFYDEESFLNREIEFLEEKSNRDNINKNKLEKEEGEHMVALCSKDKVKEDIELCLVDSAFANVVEHGFYTNDLFALNGNIYSEEEMASALDLTELYIINQSSYAIKMFIVDRLKIYQKFKFDIKAVIQLVSSILINIDAQLGYDDIETSLNSDFQNIVSANIYYKDLQELELSALMWISLSERERTIVQKEIYKIQRTDFLYFEHSKEINIEGIDKFELIVKNKNTVEIKDMETNFYLSSLELEFETFANKNPFLLTEQELNSSLEIAELTVTQYHTQEELKERLKILAKQKHINGEHIVSVFQSAIRILKKAEAKIDVNWHLAKLLNKIAFENYFELLDNEIKFSLVNQICMNDTTKSIIKKQLKTANFKLAKQKGYLCSEYSNSKYNEYFFKEEFLFKVFTNQETKTQLHTR
ncbi:MAG: hypothetical protein HRT47_01190 [Candidatus Caenarcaniphilales bacterium]|nr:hypothetical protein [Candidatus Caenarcaniphilales bacterium]